MCDKQRMQMSYLLGLSVCCIGIVLLMRVPSTDFGNDNENYAQLELKICS